MFSANESDWNMQIFILKKEKSKKKKKGKRKNGGTLMKRTR